MAIALGEGRYRYRFACAGRNWGELPDGWRFGDVAAVGVDRHDNLYVFATRRTSRDGLRPRAHAIRHLEWKFSIAQCRGRRIASLAH
jgi:hypothetical protein